VITLNNFHCIWNIHMMRLLCEKAIDEREGGKEEEFLL
jgi:hypothetical protein